MLTFSYQVDRAGWASATLADDADQLDLRVSYLSDALRDLTEATISLLLGVEEVSCVWFDEPGSYTWQFRLLYDVLHLTIVVDTSVKRGSFTTVCPVRHFAYQVLQQLWLICHNIGPDEYRARWRSNDFPLASYRRLESLLSTSRKRGI